MEKKVLTLSVKKEWFDKIVSGEKKEEYREAKHFWIVRLLVDSSAFTLRCVFKPELLVFKPYTHVLFINGYGDKPRVEKEIEWIDIDRPRKGWCPDDFLGKEFFVIKFK
jgi:hypothetical protein